MIENIYSITPQQINYIVELNIERNFQRASEKCFVTQPTLSMQVKKAEEILGFPIFDRARSPIELTPEGEKLIEILQDVQMEYGRIGQLSKQLKGNYTEQITIGIIPTISSYLLIDIFKKVNEELHSVQIKFEELKTENLIEAMQENQIDLGIMAGPYQESRLRTIPLYREEIKLYFPKSKKEKVHPKELKNEQPWLLSKGNCLRTQMVHFCNINQGNEQASMKWNYEGGNIDLLIQLVNLNGGYTLVPEYYHTEKKGLKRVFDSSTKKYPAREVIALLPNKSIKQSNCEKLIRIIQHQYSRTLKKELQILSWK